MVYKALIVGLKEKDAGKTSLALALLDYLREEEELHVCGFKPRAGNSIWYDYDVVYESLSQGRLYGKDAQRLKTASAFKSASNRKIEEFINPIHRLWAEPPRIDPLSCIPHFILDRITLWFNEGVKNVVVENEALPVEYKSNDALFRKLRAQASRMFHVRDLGALNKIIESYYSQAVEFVYKRMVEQFDALVIESYSDVALPWSGLKELDIVVGVKPGQISVYEPEKYLAAVRLATSISPQEEVTTSRIVEVVNPINVVTVPPVRSDEIVHAIKKNIPLLLQL
jgi:predicted P-loop ATPase/GTPase